MRLLLASFLNSPQVENKLNLSLEEIKMSKRTILYFVMIIFLSLLLTPDSVQASWQLQDQLAWSDPNVYVKSVAISGDYAIVGDQLDKDLGYSAGAAYIFKRDGNTWTQQAKLLASDGYEYHYFGYSVAISGDYVVVGAYGWTFFGVNYGTAYIFKRDGETWTQQTRLIPLDPEADIFFGWSIDIDGDYAIVGAYWDDDNGTQSGSAYIFKRNGDAWDQQAKLLASNGELGDLFGRSVSINGEYAIIGANGDDDGGDSAGAAYIYKRMTAAWAEQQKLYGIYPDAGEDFGQSVSIDYPYAIVGIPNSDYEGKWGAAQVFHHDGTSWSSWQILNPSGSLVQRFGWSVAMSGNYAMIGTFDNNVAFIFRRTGGSGWSEQIRLTGSSGFARSFDIDGAYAICRATSETVDIYHGYGHISGTKWHDMDDNFVRGPDEPGMDGHRIYIDANENGLFDTDEVNDITDASGRYELAVSAGTWVVAEEQSPCWQQSVPGGNGTYRLSVTAHGLYEQTDFGNIRPNEKYPSDWSNYKYVKLTADDGEVDDLFGMSVSVSGDYAIVGAHGDDDVANGAGSAYIFSPNDVNCMQWDQLIKLTASNGEAQDHFGYSVSVSGSHAIVGAYGDDTSAGLNAGTVYIFEPEDINWSETNIKPYLDDAINDYFGYLVSANNNYAVVGAYGNDDDGSESGSVYILGEDNNWGTSSKYKLTASDAGDGDQFGYSCDISGNYVIVGAYRDGDNGPLSGSAYIFFKYDDIYWTEQTKLLASDGNETDYFGYSVAINGDYAIVGAYLDDDMGDFSGSAYIFKRDGDTWNEQAKLLASDGAAGDQFGWSVSISGDYAAVGAHGDDDNGSESGSVYIFKRDGTSWSQNVKLTAPDGTADDHFGRSVSISGGHIIVGAYGDDDNGSQSGSAYLFMRNKYPDMDLTGDGFVNFEDFALFANEWLSGPE